MNANTTMISNRADSEKALKPIPPQSPRGRIRWWVWVLVLGLVAGGAYLYERRAAQQSVKVTAAPAPRAVPVIATTARKGDIGVYISALGSVTPVYTVSVTSRVQGQIMNVYYREGQTVRKGDPLLDIDPRPYHAQITQIEGQLAHDQALLNEARIDRDRYQAAFSRNAIAKQQLDDQEQVVQQDQGTVKNDEGQLENAKLNLIYCHITSPIAGRVGLRPVDPGNIVQANGTTPLVVVTQLEPITVIFSVAEDYLPQIQQKLRQGQRMAVDAFDRTQQQKIATGSLLTLDNQIDATTGTIKLKAIFPNKDNSLFPNQFVNVSLLVDTQHDATLVPTPAVQRNAQGAFVYVVKSDQTAAIRTVTVGTTDGSVTAVDGVQPGEVVAVNGFDKLQDGVKVTVRNDSNGASGRNGAGGANRATGGNSQ
ncbi:MAG: efflux RND transporter periplasmic adaptor subunit [Candidatus Acidiferrales bacterium]